SRRERRFIWNLLFQMRYAAIVPLLMGIVRPMPQFRSKSRAIPCHVGRDCNRDHSSSISRTRLSTQPLCMKNGVIDNFDCPGLQTDPPPRFAMEVACAKSVRGEER